MTTSNIALLDSNVLVYAHQSLSIYHESARILRDKGMKKEISLCICPQVLVEFYAVITNPRRVTNPFKPSEAMKEIEKYIYAEEFIKIYPKEDLIIRMIALSRKYEVKKQEIFDLQLAAIMLSNGIKRLYTYNYDHFIRFPELEILTP